MKKHGFEQGFTLIELVVTIVILSILVSVVAIKYIGVTNEVKVVACRTNRFALQTAQRLYYTTQAMQNHGHYAESLDLLTPYLKDEILPLCPSGGEYQIQPEGKVICTVEDHKS